ncbi:MAG TPA: CPBP family intramembrane glutamic endopeptidase, partial [Flavisolibacter sp.]
SGWDFNNPGLIGFIRLSQALQFFGFFVIPVVLFAYFSDPRPGQYLGLRQPTKNRYWAFALLIMIIAIPLVQYTGFLNRQINLGPEMQRWIQTQEEQANRIIGYMLKNRAPKELILNLIFIALMAGIGEELFFRGVLQRMFIRWFRHPWAGILVTAILFSAIHMQFLGFIPRLLMGVLLGAIYWYSGSLWVAIAAHFVYDAFIIMMVYFQPRLADPNAEMINPANIAVAALVSAALVALLLWQMRKNSTTSYAAIYKDDHPKKDEFSF